MGHMSENKRQSGHVQMPETLTSTSSEHNRKPNHLPSQPRLELVTGNKRLWVDEEDDDWREEKKMRMDLRLDTRVLACQTRQTEKKTRVRRENPRNDVAEKDLPGELLAATCSEDRIRSKQTSGARSWNLSARKPSNGNQASFDPGLQARKDMV